MATTNLISKSLGDILTESGNGTPDHTSPQGSYYTNKDTGTLFVNSDGSTGWDSFNRISYGDIYIQGNVTTTTVTVQNTWYALSGLSWTEGFVNGVTDSSGVLEVQTGRGGKYQFIASGTIDWIADGNFEIGVSKNGASPVTGNYQGGSVSSTVLTTCIPVVGYIDLAEGDTLQLVVRNVTNTNNIILKHGVLIVKRVGD